MNCRYLVRRILQAGLTVFGILVATFLLVQSVAGDPFYASAQEGTDAATVEALRSKFGLDRPLPEQFLAYAGHALRGELGESIVYGVPVVEVIAERVWPTLLLTGSALLLSVGWGVVLGMVAAHRPQGVVDLGVSTIALAGHALPIFLVAQMAMLILALRLDVLPLLGMRDLRVSYTGFAGAADVAYHLVLPASVLAASEIALVTRLVRSGVVMEKGKDYLRSARAKGMGQVQALARHALPNALLPVVTVVGARVGYLVSGSVIVEEIFAWPGLGTLLVSAVRSGDSTLALALVLSLAFCIVIANMLTDLAYAWLDPRVRYD